MENLRGKSSWKIFRGKSFVENLTKELCGKSFVEKMLKMSILKIDLKEKIKSSLQQRFSPIAGLALAILSSWKIILWKQFYLSKKIRSFVLVSVRSSNWCKPRHVNKKRSFDAQKHRKNLHYF